jgi:ABC-type multidrug transport system ATPase subunit
MAENQEALLKEKRKGLTKDKILLEWSNINYTITLKKTNNTKVSPILVPPESGDSSKNLEDENKRVILNNISGFALPNEVLAILGPSGSGKTSLLNIIACRQLNTNKTSTITRNVKANNIQMDVSNFGRICAYIMQDDILMESLTPRESLYFGARLKLTLDEDQIKKKVEKIISRFGLEKCADSRIGNIESKGISGGERKRTSIAYEVISDPPIIIIDEPTTGMDSFTSLVIVKYLKSLAHLGKTISKKLINFSMYNSSAEFRNI